MTNKERWDIYTSGLCSPQSFIDWGWVYTISASLQRRVWIGDIENGLFPNMYVILVGQPGIGKGLVIKRVARLLKHWKKSDVLIQSAGKLSESGHALAEFHGNKDLENAQKNELKPSSKQADIVEPLLFPVAADATTYEALVQAVGESYRHINYQEFSEKFQKNVDRVYGHSSLCFCLEELASLMRKRTHDTVNYLLGLYDCPIDYEYITVSRGKDRVRRGCLNLLAGTTPSFMSNTFDEELTNEGFTSRVFFIYAPKNRKNVMFLPPLDNEQKQMEKELLEHVKRLSCLYGRVKVDKEVLEYLENWWNESENNKHKRVNLSPKMIPYYARKGVAIQKLAMALHFSESEELYIPLEMFKLATALLEKEEKFMHLAITLTDTNPEAKCAKKILEYLGSGKKNFVEILFECHGMLNKDGIEASLLFLVETEQIYNTVEKDADTSESVQYWSLKK